MVVSCGALSWRRTHKDGEDLAGGVLGGPHHRLIGGHHNAVARLERFVRIGDVGGESAFDDVGRQFGKTAAFSESGGRAGRNLDDLRDLMRIGRGNVQRCGAWHLVATSANGVRAARDGDGMMLRFAKEVSEADSVGAADLLQREECGHHVVSLEFREERSGETGLCREARKRQVLCCSECAEFQADGVDGKWIRWCSRWQGHGLMLAGL